MDLTLRNDLGNFAFRTMKTVPLSFCLLLSVIASAQDSLHVNTPLLLYGLATYDLPGSYGLSIGASFPFHRVVKKNTNQHFTHESLHPVNFVSAELGEYRRPFAYTAIIFNAGIGTRYTKSPKHFTELSFHQGILRTVYDGQVYEVQPDGSIKELRFFGRTYGTSGFSYAANWAVQKLTPGLWFFQVRPSLWAQYPYNSFIKLHFSLQAGISYRLKTISTHGYTKYIW